MECTFIIAIGIIIMETISFAEVTYQLHTSAIALRRLLNTCRLLFRRFHLFCTFLAIDFWGTVNFFSYRVKMCMAIGWTTGSSRIKGAWPGHTHLQLSINHQRVNSWQTKCGFSKTITVTPRIRNLRCGDYGLQAKAGSHF